MGQRAIERGCAHQRAQHPGHLRGLAIGAVFPHWHAGEIPLAGDVLGLPGLLEQGQARQLLLLAIEGGPDRRFAQSASAAPERRAAQRRAKG
jgi:hypothetical protein